MTRHFTDAYIYGWRPGEYGGWRGNASYVIDPADVEELSIRERASDLKDTASVKVHNPKGKYTSPAEASLSPSDTVDGSGGSGGYTGAYGTGTYDVGLYQPIYDDDSPSSATVEHGDRVEYWIDYGPNDSMSRRWTGVVRNYTVEADGAGIYGLDFGGEDFVYGVMSMRRVSNAWENELIVSGPGDGQGIINTILANECPELDLSKLPDRTDRTSIALADVNVLEAIIELANRAGLVMYADGGALRLVKPREIRPAFTVEPSDYTLFDFSSNDDSLFNQVRVEGGQSYALDYEQTTQDGYTTVTQSNRKTEQLNTRKSEVDRLELWTDPTLSQSGEGITVRLQADDNGAPVEPGENRSDIARRKLAAEFLAENGWTTFILPDHDLPESNPWLIVEADGSVGQDIGIRTSDNALTLRTHYPYPIRVSRHDGFSQRKYRRREDTIQDKSIASLAAASDEASSYLDRNAEPTIELSFEADSDRMHALAPGDVVRADLDPIDTAGRFVCVERDLSWHDGTEECSLTLRDLDTL